MIKLQNVTKRFGDYKALDDFSLTVPKGSVYGLMGLNGAGKTTIIKHLAGYLVQDEGLVTIDDEEVLNNENIKKRIALIPDDLFFFRGYSLKEMGKYHKHIYPNWNEERFQAMIGDFGLNQKANLAKFSKGMKKQAAFCLAMAAMPDYLILDEPVDGLDPIGASQALALHHGRRCGQRDDGSGFVAQRKRDGRCLQLYRHHRGRQNGFRRRPSGTYAGFHRRNLY